MPKIAVAALVIVLVVLAALALQPREAASEVAEEIRLNDAAVVLHPTGDPEARWRFEAATVAYDPRSRETTLSTITDGERRVGEELDFTLLADRLVIGDDDDLRAPAMDVHLVEDDLDVEMEGAAERLVLVDQDAGRFEVPRIRIFGPDFGESRYEDMSVSFDFTDFQSGGAGTVGYSEFQIEERDGATDDTANDATDAAPGRNP